MMLLAKDFMRLKAVLRTSPPPESGYVWVVRAGRHSAVIGAKVVDIHTGYYNDLFPYHARGTRLANEFPIAPVDVPRGWILPFRPCTFEGMTLACAANTEAYLNALYNHDLRVEHKHRHLAPRLDARWYAPKPKIGDMIIDMHGKRTGVVVAKPDDLMRCPSSHPWAYRPVANFDYCCSSRNSNTVDGENSLL